MAKEKPSKGGGSGVPQKHLHSRLSFLHQAASYLATTDVHANAEKLSTSTTKDGTAKASATISRSSHGATRLLMHLRSVSRKSQISLAPKVKHTICKRCDALLIPGKTSSERIANSSKSGNRPSADVLEIRCDRCSTVKRFPVGMERSGRAKAAPAGDG